MMRKTLLLLAVLFVATFTACDDTVEIEKEIRSRVQSDVPYLAQLEAVYGTVYTSQSTNMLFGDNLYLRRDKAGVFYGYNLENAEIEVIEEDGDRVLRVRLPAPNRISIDREVAAVYTSSSRYKPEDEDGNQVNIDQVMNEKLESVIEQYEERSLEMTRAMAANYFKALADRYGLRLDLDFKTSLIGKETPFEEK